MATPWFVLYETRQEQKIISEIVKNIELVEIDFLNFESLEAIPKDIESAYYLIHSMSNSAKEFHVLEEKVCI